MSPEKRIARTLVRYTLFTTAARFGKEYRYAVRPILLERDGGAALIGSGILFQVGQRFFVFTAGHVAADSTNGTLLIGSVTATWHLPPFRGTAPDAGGKDPYDVAFTELPKELAEEFAGCRFLTPGETDVDDQLAPGGAYTFLGYPHRAQNLDPEREHFAPIGTIFTGRKLADRDYRRVSVPAKSQITALPDYHVAVLFDSTKVISFDGKRAIGHQHGISGGGLWRRDDLQRSSSPKLVGVILGAQTKGTRAALATRITVLFELLRHTYPDLDEFLPRSRTLHLEVERGDAPA